MDAKNIEQSAFMAIAAEEMNKSYNLPDSVRQYYKDRYKHRCENDPNFRARCSEVARRCYQKRQEEKKQDPNYVPKRPGRPRKYPIPE